MTESFHLEDDDAKEAAQQPAPKRSKKQGVSLPEENPAQGGDASVGGGGLADIGGSTGDAGGASQAGGSGN